MSNSGGNCSNCGDYGHTFKNCNEPIISNGIIAIYIKNISLDILPFLEDYIIKNLKIFTDQYKIQNEHYRFDTDIKIKSKINESIQFLMVQRKNSLGYLEFIRGRYNLENLLSLTHLLEQMTPEELDNIINKDFDLLWNDLWDSNNIRNKNHHKEYLNSKQKFNQLKLVHNNILLNTLPLYNFNEWGFPKGRRELYESDLVCAIREFEEETTLGENDYIILEKCKSIRENLIGTNGISYAHNYFLSILNDNLSKIDKSNREISQSKVLNLNECLEKIRPYHKNKLMIIKYLYTIINNFLIENQYIN
jgi:ADP-ribose pyrophosphatase YjhB (NUDIX family)